MTLFESSYCITQIKVTLTRILVMVLVQIMNEHKKLEINYGCVIQITVMVDFNHE